MCTRCHTTLFDKLPSFQVELLHLGWVPRYSEWGTQPVIVPSVNCMLPDKLQWSVFCPVCSSYSRYTWQPAVSLYQTYHCFTLNIVREIFNFILMEFNFYILVTKYYFQGLIDKCIRRLATNQETVCSSLAQHYKITVHVPSLTSTLFV